jgi:hypothetical protein
MHYWIVLHSNMAWKTTGSDPNAKKVRNDSSTEIYILNKLMWQSVASVERYFHVNDSSGRTIKWSLTAIQVMFKQAHCRVSKSKKQ